MNDTSIKETDFIVIGSGFGGSVSALRLSEKGYNVTVVEKGRWFQSEDFPKNNMEVKKWLWEPKLGLKGFFQMTYFRHVTVLSGVGVGGGSLTYANTLPIPKPKFFTTGTWAGLANWEAELQPFYGLAYRMLGASLNPKFYEADLTLKKFAEVTGRAERFEPTMVGVYFGEEGKTVPDPYFGGNGPERTGCIFCGACMTGCRHNAKNTLDKNYLHLAQNLGTKILAETEVYDIKPSGRKDGSNGYEVFCKTTFGKEKLVIKTKGIVFSGGVLGTVPLLLKLKRSSMPSISDLVGCNIRTNNESLTLYTTTEKTDKNFSKGLAIGSIVHTDEYSHLESVRYGEGSTFFKYATLPLVNSKFALIRILGIPILAFLRPILSLKTIFTRDYSTKTQIMLFMQTLDSTLRLKEGLFSRIKTVKEAGPKPTPFMPEVQEISKFMSNRFKAITFVNAPDNVLGTPTTAHILGGAVMGKSSLDGVIDSDNRLFGYKNAFVCDGSMISANPGVNPSLSITAISERAMSKISPKG